MSAPAAPRPLLILDCDEVVLRFAAPFREWLRAARGIALRFDSFALVGNMRHIADGRPVEATAFPALLEDFFAEGQPLQAPVPGVVEALAQLGARMDIVCLSNVPEAHAPIRRAVLASHGLDMPLYANDGGKGRMVRALAAGRRAVFVDDLPPHHESVARHAAHVGRLHMVADEELRPLIPAAPMAHARIDTWAEAADWIGNWMEGD